MWARDFFWKGNKLKEYKTIEQQILILKNRGLNFENEEFARTKLLETNYYNTVNGYKRLFIAKNNENDEGIITYKRNKFVDFEV